MKENDDDYRVVFRGATISKKEAKRVGVTFLFGAAGIVTVGLSLELQDKAQVFLVSLALAGIGYFGVAKKIWKYISPNQLLECHRWQ